MPADEGIGLDVHQGITPREQAAEHHHSQPDGIIGPSRLHLPLLEEGKLLSQKEVLGCQCAVRPHTEREETGEIVRDGRQRREAECQGSENGAWHARLVLHVTRRYMADDWG